MNRNQLLPLLAAALGAADLAAQTLPVPNNANLVDGHQSVTMPFGVPGFRTQILVEGSAIGPTGAAVTGLRFRLDRNSVPAAAGTVPNVTIRLSETSVIVPNLSTTFASNVTGPAMVVFQGSVSLPGPGVGHAGPMPWDILIPLQTPFVYTVANGNLLIDIVAANAAGGPATHWLDAMQPGGSATQYGQGGDNPTFDFLNLIAHTGNSLEPRQISIGNVVEFSSTLFFTNPPGLLALGLVPTPGPIDLAFVDAPNQFLHIDPIGTVAHNWTQTFLGYASTFSLAVPNDPSWIDLGIYAQSAVLEPAANPLGLVLSHALEVRIADNNQVFLSMQQVDADDPSAPAGTLLDFGFSSFEFGAVPVLLEGAFF
jgi:hypothetical protein